MYRYVIMNNQANKQGVEAGKNEELCKGHIRESEMVEWWNGQKKLHWYLSKIDETVREEVENWRHNLIHEELFTHVSYQLYTALDYTQRKQFIMTKVITHYQNKTTNKAIMREYIIRLDNDGVEHGMNMIIAAMYFDLENKEGVLIWKEIRRKRMRKMELNRWFSQKYILLEHTV